MTQFIAGVAATIILLAVLLNVHIVRHDDGVGFYKKEGMTFEQTYIDTRDMSFSDYAKLPKVVAKDFNKRKIDQAKKKVGEGLDSLKEAITGD